MEFGATTATLSKKLSNGSAYDGIFATPIKFRAPSLSSRLDDYCEIFGGSEASLGSSIPILEIPELDERKIFDDVRRKKVDYSKVFGGFGNLDNAVPYEKLFAEPKIINSFPKEARRGAKGENQSMKKDPANYSKENPLVSQKAASLDGGRKINLSYHKINQGNEKETIGTIHAAQLLSVPAYTCLVEEVNPRVDKSIPVVSDAYPSSCCRERKKESGHCTESVAGPPPDNANEQSSNSGVKGHNHSDSIHLFFDGHEISHGNDGTNHIKVFLSGTGVGELDSQNGCAVKSGANKCDASKRATGADSPSYLDDMVDSNSEAAASVAALKKAIAEAQETINVAIELMKRKKEGVPDRVKRRSDCNLKTKLKKEAEDLDKTIGLEETNIWRTFTYMEALPEVLSEIGKPMNRAEQVIPDQRGKETFVTKEAANETQQKSKSAQLKEERVEIGWKEDRKATVIEFKHADNDKKALNDHHQWNEINKCRIGSEKLENFEQKIKVVEGSWDQSEGNVNSGNESYGRKEFLDHGVKDQRLEASEEAEETEQVASFHELADCEGVLGEQEVTVEEKKFVCKEEEAEGHQQPVEVEKEVAQEQNASEQKVEISCVLEESGLRELLEPIDNEEELNPQGSDLKSNERQVENWECLEDGKKRNEAGLMCMYQESEHSCGKEGSDNGFENIQVQKIIEEILDHIHEQEIQEKIRENGESDGNAKHEDAKEDEKELEETHEKIRENGESDGKGKHEDAKEDEKELEETHEKIRENGESDGKGKHEDAKEDEKELEETHEKIRENCESDGKGKHEDAKEDKKELEETKEKRENCESDGKGRREDAKETEKAPICLMEENEGGRKNNGKWVEVTQSDPNYEEKQTKEADRTTETSPIHEQDETEDLSKVQLTDTSVQNNETLEVTLEEYSNDEQDIMIARNTSFKAREKFKEPEAVEETYDCSKENTLETSSLPQGAFELKEAMIQMQNAKETIMLDSASTEVDEANVKTVHNQDQCSKEAENDSNLAMLVEELTPESVEISKEVNEAEDSLDEKIDKNRCDSSYEERLVGSEQNVRVSQLPCMSEWESSTFKNQESKTSDSYLKENHQATLGMEEKKTNGTSQKVELEKKQMKKIDGTKEREREREKEKIAVERAIREARERAFAEARERAVMERATAEARRKNLSDGRERPGKTTGQPNEKTMLEKAAMEAKLKAERAAVERATAEARARALERALSEKAASEARYKSENFVVEKSFGASRDDATKPRFYSKSFNNGDEVTKYTDVIGGRNGDSAQRCKARSERYQRIGERVAKALAEKNMRDRLAQKEQEERNRVAEALDADVKRWSSGKEGNLRALLSTLQYILGPDSGWQSIPLTDIVTNPAVKKAYRKATLFVHPDKLQQRGATIQQKYACEKVFDLLKEAWNRFNMEER